MKVVCLAAVAANGVIGDDGTLVWNYPEDLQHFKETTMGHPVIMGRRTYEDIVSGLGGPLPGRTNIVLSTSRDSLAGNPAIVDGIHEALNVAGDTEAETAYVIGGESVYAQFLDADLVDELCLTEIPEEYEGDARFPRWGDDEWDAVNRRSIGENGLSVVTYRL